MITLILWPLITLQILMGAFDTLYHHELTERLAWRPSQQHELRLHGIRNLLYAVLFLLLGWTETHGILAMLVIAVLAAEVVITLIDFVEVLGRRISLPRWLAPGALTVTHGELGDGWFSFTLDLVHPRFGALIRQTAVFREAGT